MLSMQFTSLLTESGKRKWGRVRVRVRVVNGKAVKFEFAFLTIVLTIFLIISKVIGRRLRKSK